MTVPQRDTFRFFNILVALWSEREREGGSRLKSSFDSPMDAFSSVPTSRLKSTGNSALLISSRCVCVYPTVSRNTCDRAGH